MLIFVTVYHDACIENLLLRLILFTFRIKLKAPLSSNEWFYFEPPLSWQQFYVMPPSSFSAQPPPPSPLLIIVAQSLTTTCQCTFSLYYRILIQGGKTHSLIFVVGTNNFIEYLQSYHILIFIYYKFYFIIFIIIQYTVYVH